MPRSRLGSTPSGTARPALPADNVNVELVPAVGYDPVTGLVRRDHLEAARAAIPLGPLGLLGPMTDWRLPDLTPLWSAIRDRLKGQAELDALHGGPGRSYAEGDQSAGAEGGASASTQWGRSVVVPVMTLWEQEFEPTRPFDVGVQIREEQGVIQGAPVPRTPLAIAHQLVFKLLHGWLPAGPFPSFTVIAPFRQVGYPTEPLRDEAGVPHWFSTATWRTSIMGLAQ